MAAQAEYDALMAEMAEVTPEQAADAEAQEPWVDPEGDDSIDAVLGAELDEVEAALDAMGQPDHLPEHRNRTETETETETEHRTETETETEPNPKPETRNPKPETEPKPKPPPNLACWAACWAANPPPRSCVAYSTTPCWKVWRNC